MKSSLPRLQKIVLAAAGLFLALLLFLWQAFPRILHAQAEKFVAEKTGHRLTLERPEFNPFALALRIGKLQLAEPDGKPLLSFDALLVDISAASIVERALVFDAIRLDGLAATLVELPGDTLNWTSFLEALKSKEPEKQTGLPRLDIRSFVLAGGRIDYADRRRGEGFSARAEPLDIELANLSTLPDDDGRYRLTARTTLGAQIEIAGEVQLNPLAVTGTFSLADLQLAKLAPYLGNVLPVPPEGVAGLAASYRVGNGGDKFDVVVEQIRAKLADLRVSLKEAGPVASVAAIEVKDGSFQLSRRELAIGAVAIDGGRLALPHIDNPPQFAALGIENIRVALAERSASVGSVALKGARIEAVRQADGSIDLQEALKAALPARPAVAEDAPAAEAAPPWRFRIEKTEVADLGVSLRDAGITPPAELALDNIALQVEGIGNDLSQPLPLRLSFDARGGGRFEAEGRVVPDAPSADVGFKLNDLNLKIAQPYLTAKTTLTLTDGRLSAQGRAGYDAKGPTVRGEFAVRDLRLMEPGIAQPLLAWKTFGSRALTLTQKQLDLGELRLNGLDTQLIIDKDKSLNLKRVLKPSAPATKLAAVPPPPAAGAVPPAPAFLVNIDRLRFSNGEMDFADHSLVLPFGTRIHSLRGSIAGLSNRPGAAGQIELDGAVDDYGMARAVGQVDLFNPTEALDMRVQFRNVEMTRLTPYTATFAGRKIDSGKLSLDLQYKIKQRQLQGENQVVMDKLTLGERVESPTAKDLPLDLAIAILQDSDGRIDLGLPVSGSLDDPEFSYGAIVWKAIANVITKIVTAPFRALGALFGGGGEQLERIVFEAGAAQLTPPEREKIVRVAEALAKRPTLLLSVGGSHAEADRVALQDAQLRRAVLMKAGQRVPEKGDPGPVSTRQPKVQEALEALYKERVGAADLAALKEGFRSANPGQLEESMAGKMMSRLSGLLREKKTLGADEVAQLKGADFHTVLYERLRARETVAAERLQALAQARGEGVLETLRSAGVAAERLRLLPPEAAKDEGDAGGEIPLRLALEPMKAN
jgi:uncharacterized protein involved in outer membrane biogenesis